MSFKDLFGYSCQIMTNVEEIYHYCNQITEVFKKFESEDNIEYIKIQNNSDMLKKYNSFKKRIEQYKHDYLYSNQNYMGHDNLMDYDITHENIYSILNTLKKT